MSSKDADFDGNYDDVVLTNTVPVPMSKQNMRIFYSLVFRLENGNLVHHRLDNVEVDGSCVSHHSVCFLSQHRGNFDDLILELFPLSKHRGTRGKPLGPAVASSVLYL